MVIMVDDLTEDMFDIIWDCCKLVPSDVSPTHQLRNGRKADDTRITIAVPSYRQ